MINIPVIVTFDIKTHKKISKEEIRNIIEIEGQWEGFSEEYGMAKILSYKIWKDDQNTFHVKVSFGDPIFIIDNLLDFEAAYIALSFLFGTYWQIGRAIGEARFSGGGRI